MVNTSANMAEVRLIFHGLDGQTIASTPTTLSPGSQVARLAQELFPGAQAPGWIEAAAANPGVSALWLGGDFQQFGDGAAPTAASSDQIAPFITENSELNLINTGDGALNTVIRLYDSFGRETGPPVVVSLSPKGAMRELLSDMFPREMLENASHARLTCTNPFVASVIIRDFLATPSWSVVNAVAFNGRQTEIYFPHVVSGAVGGADYESINRPANHHLYVHTRGWRRFCWITTSPASSG
jgi:hypothetical protein